MNGGCWKSAAGELGMATLPRHTCPLIDLPISAPPSCSPEGCGTCDLDPTKCDEDSSCLDEYGPGDAPGICKKCLTANCTTCGGTYTACTECALGFRFDAPTDQCQGGSRARQEGRADGGLHARAAGGCSGMRAAHELPT